MSKPPIFQGSREIEALRQRVEPLASSLDKLGKPEAPIALDPKDFDLLARWPRAGGFHSFVYLAGGIYWQQHRLRRLDGPQRYRAGAE